MGPILPGELRERKDEFPQTREVKGGGLTAALESSESNRIPTAESAANQVLRKGFMLASSPDANLIRFLPPLTIEEDEIDNLIKHLRSALTKRIQ